MWIIWGEHHIIYLFLLFRSLGLTLLTLLTSILFRKIALPLTRDSWRTTCVSSPWQTFHFFSLCQGESPGAVRPKRKEVAVSASGESTSCCTPRAYGEVVSTMVGCVTQWRQLGVRVRLKRIIGSTEAFLKWCVFELWLECLESVCLNRTKING